MQTVRALHSRSLGTLRPALSAQRWANSRRFSVAPAFRTEARDDLRTSPAPSGTCYVANIPFKVTAEQLKDAFSEFGKVESVRLLTSGTGLHRGAGFVQFESTTDAVNFVEAHAADPIFVFDRQLYVGHADKPNVPKSADPSDTLMVSDFRGQSADEVRVMFGSYADSILAVRFSPREVDLPSKKAFVQFRDVSMATEAMEAFRNQSGNPQVAYARQRQSPSNDSLTSRLSHHRSQ